MARVKGGVTSQKRRRNVLRQVKGYRFARSKKERAAKEAIVHAGKYAFAHRRVKKNDFRTLWNIRLNAALRTEGMNYSKFIGALKKHKIALNRKMLSELAEVSPSSFKAVLAAVR